MLVTFKTDVGVITMFGNDALTILQMMGHSATEPGAILAADVPAALSRLNAAVEKEGSSCKCILSGSNDKNVISFMQRHNFKFKERDISETIGHFVQGFNLFVGAFQRLG